MQKNRLQLGLAATETNRCFLKLALAILCLLLCSIATVPIVQAQLVGNDEDDFIILDDRGEGAEPEEDDVPLSGRKPRPKRGDASAPGAKRDGSDSAGSKVANEEPEVTAPKRFEPTERVSEDLSISFPADI